MTSLSVVVPSRDAGRGLLGVLSAIFESLPPRPAEAVPAEAVPAEVLVVDDGSTDGSVEAALERFPALRTIRHERPMGAAAARNRGIQETSGRFIAFIDSDVTLRPGALEKLLAAAEAGFDIAHTLPWLEGKVPMFEPRIAREYPVITACFLVRRAVLARLDRPFDESYEIYNEDLDFFLRCRLAGLTHQFVPGCQALHPLKGSSHPARRYYLDLRSSIYGAIKFSFTRTRLAGFGSVKLVLENARALVVNRDFRHPGYFEPRKKRLLAKIARRLFPEYTIHRTRLRGVGAILRAIAWNLARLRETLAERERLAVFWRPEA